MILGIAMRERGKEEWRPCARTNAAGESDARGLETPEIFRREFWVLAIIGASLRIQVDSSSENAKKPGDG
jgi:hypothetical protein